MKAMKTLFIWLLVSFIPLQGMAANALLVCKAANQAAVVRAMSAAEEHAHPCVDMQAQQDDGQDRQQDNDSTCVAQFAGVPWIPATQARLPSLQTLPAVISYAGFHLPSFIPEGPERPPRGHFL